MSRLLALSLLFVAVGVPVPADDPLRVSPEAYSLLHEDERVRVLLLKLGAGESDAFHGHPDGVYYIQSGSTVRLHAPDGTGREVTLRPGRAGFQPATAGHRIENIGDTELRAIMVELKPAEESGVNRDLLEQRARDEIVALHQFFEDWFRARLPDADASFDRLERGLADDFIFVSPEGGRLDRPALVEGVRRSHGKWRDDDDARIWIDDVRLHRVAGNSVLLTYKEWQHASNSRRGRLSTVLLGWNEDEPQTMQWLHVHEVWIPTE